ncbi:hypothetical protein [Streptomyces prasinus]
MGFESWVELGHLMRLDSEPDVVAVASIRCFDEVAQTHGESGYRGKWGENFPRTELEALRRLWRTHQHPQET